MTGTGTFLLTFLRRDRWMLLWWILGDLVLYLATVYSARGHGVRAPVVFYNRANEAGALLKPGDFDWKEIFGSGVRWFHSGGIFAALSETTGELIIEAMQAAIARAAVEFLRVGTAEPAVRELLCGALGLSLWKPMLGLAASIGTLHADAEHW